MKIIVLLLVSMILTPSIHSQELVGLKQQQAQKKLHAARGNKPELRFDENGSCIAELYQFNTKDDLERKINQVLQKKKYAWIRINENQHVSDFKGQLLMEVQDEGPLFTLQLLRTAWTQELYNLLLKN